MSGVDVRNIAVEAYGKGLALDTSKGSDRVNTTDGREISSIKTGVLFEPDIPANPRIMVPEMRPGQFWDAAGSTLYNPLDSDPKVEAVLGKKTYKAIPRDNTPDQFKLQIAEMQSKIDQLTGIITGMASTSQNTAVKETEAVESDGTSMTELRAKAKSLGIKAPFGTSKEQLITLIAEAETNA